MSERLLTDLKLSSPEPSTEVVSTVNWTNTTAHCTYARVGPWMIGNVYIHCTGNPAGLGTTLLWTLPAGFKIARYALPTGAFQPVGAGGGGTGNYHIVGTGYIVDTSASEQWIAAVGISNATQLHLVSQVMSAGVPFWRLVNDGTVPTTFATNDTVSFDFRVPIDGWA